MVIKLKFILSAVAKEAFKRLGGDTGSLYSAAIAFFALISLFPLMLLAVGVLGVLIGSYEAALESVIELAREIIPIGTEELEHNLRALIRQPGLLGGLGLLGFLWTGMQVFIILQKVMNLALDAEQPKGFVRKRGIALLMVIVAVGLVAASLAITSLLAPDRWGVEAGAPAIILEVLRFLTRAIFAGLAFALAYRFLPVRDVGNVGPLIGGAAAGLLFMAATYVFRWYVVFVADYAEVYGAIAGVVVLLLWIYYASLIAVIGAQLTSVYAREAEA